MKPLFQRLAAALALACLFAAPALAQNKVCPTAAPGDNSDKCASTQFVQGAVASVPLTPPGGTNGQVQYNNAGGFGGYTNTQLTALINTFTATLPGSVPASGGGTTNFLRADGAFAPPPVF